MLHFYDNSRIEPSTVKAFTSKRLCKPFLAPVLRVLKCRLSWNLVKMLSRFSKSKVVDQRLPFNKVPHPTLKAFHPPLLSLNNCRFCPKKIRTNAVVTKFQSFVIHDSWHSLPFYMVKTCLAFETICILKICSLGLWTVTSLVNSFQKYGSTVSLVISHL